MDPLSIVADEVALEGLDGITLPTVWIRLESREPKFPLKLDDCTKDYIWRSLVCNEDMCFYQLPKEREDVVLVDRFKDVDPETGMQITESFTGTSQDVYPVRIIAENENGIQGSCVFFKERKDITKHVRSKDLTSLLTLEEAMERYGRKLVIVASQVNRFRALIGSESDPDIKLSDESYCVLEKVARARWQGEIQTDLHGSSFKVDARKFHYLRKSLVRHQLVTLQSYVKRMPSGQQQHSILLLLKRFHMNRRTLYDSLMEFVTTFLQQSPDQFSTVMQLKDKMKVDERIFKRILKHMRLAKLVSFFQYPLEDLDPSAGPCLNKNGNKVKVRCIKLLKPYVKKGVTDTYDDDDEDEEVDRSRELPTEGRLLEMDYLSQAYGVVLSCGTRGISQRSIGLSLNASRLDSRQVCRKMERIGVIKGFMEDEGRQRTTKFISHRCVGVSDRLQLFAQEKEKNTLLSVAPATPGDAAASSSETPAARDDGKAAASADKKKAGKGNQEEKEDGRQAADGSKGGNKRKRKGRQARGRKKSQEEKKQTTEDAEPAAPVMQPPAEREAASCNESVTPEAESISAPDKAPTEEEEPSSSALASSVTQTETTHDSANAKDAAAKNQNVVSQLEAPHYMERPVETYRMLKRKNLIVEAVNNLRIIEGIFPLQKMINEQEKQEGVSSKCCKKTILRLVHGLSRKGLLKFYTTTIIQDGITKKIDMIAHPSIQSNDHLVNQVIEQVRFKIANSYITARNQHAEERARELEKDMEDTGSPKALMSRAERRRALIKEDDFKPVPVPGLSRAMGFQPKMQRLRAVHKFLWYIIYGHPLQQTSAAAEAPDAKRDPKEMEDSVTSEAQGTSDGTAAGAAAKREAANGGVPNLDAMSDDEGEESRNSSASPRSQCDAKVYVDEDSWKRFVPPVRTYVDYARGWANVGDMLLCLPLSIFTQIIQINYKVDGLDEFVNDPVKKHYLIRMLPARTKRQLLFKRKYIMVFSEHLQKLAYMGLLQFGPSEKFQEKEQVFAFLKRNTTIVDTTNAEPHYWLIAESPDKPFERRHYALNTYNDVQSYWFDLMCVCLNTPLGVIRSKRRTTEDDGPPSFVQERYVFVGLAYLLKGSADVCDDGAIPGDGKGAAGLHSEFFGHLKRNWLWTNHLLSVKGQSSGLDSEQTQTRLKSLLTRSSLTIALAGGTTKPHAATKRPLLPINIEVGIEPASRNQQVVGGKKQKRKRVKKDPPVKVPKKRKKAEPKKRGVAKDEQDHQALKMMTRQRVFWTVKEDSLMMLCCVATHLLNSKLKRPFVPHCVVRDLLHSEFEVSLDKTSFSVGRRCRYILKNPQTLLNYRICVAEVYQDKALMKVLDELKPADPDNPKDCAKAFCEYTRLFRQKFSSIMDAAEAVIPDSKQELFSRFKVTAIDCGKDIACKDSLNCVEDIHAIVLHNLIQSTLAMTNSQMKTSRSFQTFHMYSKYDQELLCQVFIQIRKKAMVNRRRVSQSLGLGPKKNRAVPMLPMSYQLSQSYFRSFTWRFPQSLCTDAFCFLKNLINNPAGDSRPATAFYHEPEIRSANGEDALEKKALSKKREKQSAEKEDGGPVNEAEEQSEKTNENVTNDADKGQAATTTTEPVADSEKTGEKAQDDSLEGPSATPDKAPSDSDELPDVSDMVQFSLNSVGGACAVSLSLMSLGLLSMHISIPKRLVVVDTNLVDNDVVKNMTVLDEEDDDEEDGDECEGKKTMQVKSQQASHTKYLMMRGFCAPGIVKLRNLSTTDNIVVESCRMRLQLRDTPIHRVFSEEDLPPLDLTICGPSLLPSSLSYSIHRSSGASSLEAIQPNPYTHQDVEACALLRRSLDEAGQYGVDERDLYRVHEDLLRLRPGHTRNLQQYMKDLEETNQALRVGSLGPRWVLMQHADPWLLTINTKQWSNTRLTSSRLSYMTKQHNVPFMRKRCMRQRQSSATEETPAKRPHVEKEDGADAEDGAAAAGETTKEKSEEDQIEKTGEGREEKPPDPVEEAGKTAQPEEEAESSIREDEKTEQKDEEEDNLDEERTEGPSSPPSGSAEHEEVSFISRPWRMVDGKLNRQVCKGMLEAVLYHIMSRPGVTQQALLEHYKDLLQPVAVMDLVQALIELGCVTKKTLVKCRRASLFSRFTQPTESQNQGPVEEPDTIFYEPTISCCLRLCKVLPNERHWNSSTP
ncbi:unnamed protein product [Ophioblennius macclurei]